MNRAQLAKAATIGSMYMAQTFASGFVAQLLPAIYREQQLPLEQYWIFSICLAPMALRFLWAPFVDRYGNARLGRRRSWIIPCTAAAAAMYLALGFIEPTIDNLFAVSALVLVVSVVLATQEVAVDGYFVENLEPRERGFGSGVRGYMESFAELGALAGLAAIYHRWGWPAAVGAAAGLLVVFTLPGMIRRETPIDANASRRASPPSVMAFLRRRDSWLIVPVLVSLGLALGMYFSMLGAFLVDKGFAIDQVGLILGMCVLIGWMTGGPIAVRVVDRYGVRAALRGYIVAIPICFAGALWLAGLPRQTVMVTVAVLSLPTLVLAQITVTSYVARISWCSQAQAGTDFATQGAAVRLGATAAVGVGGAVAAVTGWQYFFVVYGVYAVLATFVFYALERRVAELVSAREREALGDGIHGAA